MADSSQKFIAHNRAPRVQIEYEVELYGAEKKVQLPFVMGVMSDLSGKSTAQTPSVADRNFLEIDVDNFDERMKAMAPRVEFAVPNTLTGENNLAVDLTFEKMADFTPVQIASKIEPLRKLLEARTQLATLMTYMDGKTGAEALIEKILADPALLEALASSPVSEEDSEATLNALREVAPEDMPADRSVEDALASLPEVETAEVKDRPDDILSNLASAAPEATSDDTSLQDALSSLPDAAEHEVSGDETGDVLSNLAAAAPTGAPEDTSVADALSSIPEVEVSDEQDGSADTFSDLAEATPEDAAGDTTADDVLSALPELEIAEEEDASEEFLSRFADAAPDEETEDNALDDALSSSPDQEETAEADQSDGMLADLEPEETDEDTAVEDALSSIPEAPDAVEEDHADILSDLADAAPEDNAVDDVLGDLADAAPEGTGAAETADDVLAAMPELDTSDDVNLDDLLGDLGADEDGEAASVEDTADDLDLDLDDLLGDGNADGEDAGPDDQLTETEEAREDPSDTDEAKPDGEPRLAFGRMSADRPDPERLKRTRFRVAIFGDFTGRAARGQIKTGDALAARKPILLDPDTAEDVIESFATTLVLPIGKDGAGIEVKLNELDDLHPDELYEKVELFDGLSGLKSQLNSGATADHAAKQLIAWGEEFGHAVAPPRKTSGSNTVRADLKLSDFQKLIGDTSEKLAQASPVDDLLKRVVGPHIRSLPSPDVTSMQAAVDEALSTAMRMVLHHPEFQAVEAQWRSLDLIARNVEDDASLDIILYDVSAEEIAADLAAEEDLAKTGLVRLLTDEPLDEENGRGGYSALIGLYTFEETPPHAELLGRIGRVAAHVDAPFISAITPAYLDIKKEDRHPLVVKAWDMLRAMPEAGHVGLASPRFLLRRPYGTRSEPIYEFDFEEFTESEGLRGMLWANPAVLVTILLARSFKQNGKAMKLGSVMSLGGMPYHFVNDRYGDQVALPCTERNVTLEKHEHSVQRGYMPVLSVKGRDEIRLGSFNSVAGQEILGPWSGVPVPELSPDVPPKPEAENESANDDLDIDFGDIPGSEAGGDDDFNLDDLDLDLDLGDDDSGDLDDLLASFGDDSGDSGDDGEEMDPELAALLADL